MVGRQNRKDSAADLFLIKGDQHPKIENPLSCPLSFNSFWILHDCYQKISLIITENKIKCSALELSKGETRPDQAELVDIALSSSSAAWLQCSLQGSEREPMGVEQPPDSHQGRFRASQLTKTEAAQPAEPFLSQIEPGKSLECESKMVLC